MPVPQTAPTKCHINLTARAMQTAADRRAARVAAAVRVAAAAIVEKKLTARAAAAAIVEKKLTAARAAALLRWSLAKAARAAMAIPMAPPRGGEDPGQAPRPSQAPSESSRTWPPRVLASGREAAKNILAARRRQSALQHDGWGEEDVSATILKRLDLPAAARGSLAVDLENRFPVAMAQLARGSMGARLRARAAGQRRVDLVGKEARLLLVGLVGKSACALGGDTTQ